jgi:hypothetical protein
MAGRNYGTMFQGYYYDESKTHIHFNVWVDNGPSFIGVAYHSKGQLVEQLVNDKYDKKSIKVDRVDTRNHSVTRVLGADGVREMVR